MSRFTVARCAALFLIAFGLAACSDSTGGGATEPSAAAQACLRDVTQTTNNKDVMLVSSDFSEAGTSVIVGVGEQRALWSCIGYADGTTADITSLTDEGTL